MSAVVRTAIAVTIVCGCGPSKPASKPPAKTAARLDTAELWALAPEGTRFGVVVAPGSGRALFDGANTFTSSIRASGFEVEGLTNSLAMLDKVGVDALSRVYDLDGAVAFFVAGDGYNQIYGIWPVTDRAAYRALYDGVLDGDVDVFERDGQRIICAPRHGQYRCAPTVAALEAWKPLATSPIADWPSDLRGDIELYLGVVPELSFFDGPVAVRGKAELERGGITIELELAGRSNTRFEARPPVLAPTVLDQTAAGVALVSPAAGSRALEALAKGSARLSGVSVASLAAASTGEVAAIARPGSGGGELAIGIRDPEPFRALIRQCTGGAPGVVALVRKGEQCTLEIMWTAEPTTLVLTVDSRAFRITRWSEPRAGATRATASLPAALREPGWLGVLWFRGDARGLVPTNPLFSAAMDKNGGAALRWFATYISELGVAVRHDDRGFRGYFRVSTPWRNPPELFARLEPLLARQARGEDALAELEALAADHPDSPLATDRALGSHGAYMAVAGLGLVGLVGSLAGSEGDEVIRELAAIRDKMCTCKDAPCAEAVNAEFKAWLERHDDKKGSAAQQAEAKSLAEVYTKCWMNVMGQNSSPLP